ncbi:XrtA/PEP-CTERM system TPR-repeat protein PrsT [Nitrosospira sp. Nsp18]|uniref:XrtA/PEP-CTERM system TPR-repeat protein PrsT n=1 Tax=Nitrosospira sp. Nsp18 TaxID=1855334 RepID=UPI00210A85EF|nr:XrtA/PEP-CTERM system TPR-repeat protein PrsT [Nitrosospira sp. Nsp18]
MRRNSAKELFEGALKGKPDFSDALIGLSKCALANQDLEATNQFAEQAVAKNPGNPDAWLYKGNLLRVQGKVDLALAAYDQVTKLKPDSPTAYLDKALLEIGARKFDVAKSNIDAARAVAPGSLMVFYTQALLDFNEGKYGAALDSLQQILSKAPDHMPSLLLAGAVQIALGSAPQAEQHLKQYLKKDPQNLYARKLLASSLLKSHQPQRVIDVLTPALKSGQQDPQLFALAGEAYMQSKDFVKATENFEKASQLAPKNALLHTALSMSKLGQGENGRAVAELETAAKLDPKSSQTGILLVMTHLRLREFDKALVAAKTVEKENPDNPLVQNLKGGIYMGKNDVANARASFERALSLQPAYFPAVANLAQLDLLEKKPDAAKKRFEAILEKDKKNIQAMTALARLALSQQQNKEATAWLERASQENPESQQAAMLLAEHYLRSGEKQKSLTLAQKLQSSNPTDPGVLELLAQAQLAGENKAAALESYKKLAAMRPEYARAQLRIASIYAAMENPSAASEALKKALAIKPDYVDAQLAQTALEVRKGNHEQALAIARQIQKQQGKLPVGYILEGDLLMTQKEPAAAARAYEQAFALSKSGSLLTKLHASLREAGKGKEATSRLTEWLKQHPADAATRMYLAEIYMAERQNTAAIEQFQVILKQAPDFMPALNNLAWLYQQEKDPRALEYAEKAYRVTASDPTVLDTLGWVLVEQGNIARGLPFLEKATSLVPESTEFRYHLAVGLGKSGNKAGARKELEQLLGTGKNFAGIDEARSLLKQMQ